MKEEHNYAKAYKTNLNRARRKITARCTGLYKRLVEKEIEFYGSSSIECECGETQLLSNMLHVDLPCSHRMLLGAAFPSMPEENKLVLINSIDGLKIEYCVKERISKNTSISLNKAINEKAAKTVRKFSKFKKINVIAEGIPKIDVEDETAFANGMPLNFFISVSKGIHEYHEKKEKRCAR